MSNITNIQKTMSTREIADLVEARHNDVTATVERLFGKGLLRSSRETRREFTGGRPVDVYDLIERDTQLAEPASPEPGEWIEWAGVECPIADDVQHQIRTRDGWESNVDTDAYGWDWTRRHGDNAIVAYRVLA